MENLKCPIGDVIMVTSPEKSINYRWYKNSEKLSPQLKVLSITEVNQIDVENIFGVPQVQENTIWMKHPFVPNKYIDINKAEDVLIQAKLDGLGLVAKHLGVKRFKTAYAIVTTSEAEYDIDGGVRYKAVKGDMKVEIKKDDKNTFMFYRDENYSGNFSPESYNKAKAIAKEYGLYGEPDISYLIKQRDPQDENCITSQKVHTILTKELNTQLDVALSLNAIGIFALDTHYKQTISKRKEIQIETELVF